MPVPLLTARRPVFATILLPFRIVLGAVAVLAVLAGGLGVIAWTIQLIIGGSGGGPLPPGVMWLACLGAALAGLAMLIMSGPTGADELAVTTPIARELADEGDLPVIATATIVDGGTGLKIRPLRADELDDYVRALN